ncbi:Similar to gpatch4: G patch domain-containing protein 4 (Xenopus laevis) [Cotesia congregata]|uniref:Similar to gpatch4: G patch domain-containing protein 4 (Xenopus laevis) n=1 Tax=Cotesia congregata TaxID=51543 RepID=A0A8J2HF86_COTCN|nr:Similar to gpatch4: G patch domain-containing protein 4 (Xenopus laevis) [Cotesia congregata]
MSDFAKSQLEKFGWVADTSGNQWWNSVYNQALNNINVDSSSENKPVFKVTKSNAVEIAAAKLNINIGNSKKSKDGLVYGNFVKTSTLEGSKEVQSASQKKLSAKKDDPVMFKDFIVDDDKLFKACGGRTAHKGARHGLKLSGKLARIQQQELYFANLAEVKSGKKRAHIGCTANGLVVKEKPPELVDDALDNKLNDEDDQYKSVSKKSSRKLKRKLEDLSHKLSSSLCLEETNDNGKKNKNKIHVEPQCSEKDADVGFKRKKKKKKEKKEIIDCEFLNHKIEKKKKKKHKKKEKAKLELVSKNLTNFDEIVNNVSESLVKVKIDKKKTKK